MEKDFGTTPGAGSASEPSRMGRAKEFVGEKARAASGAVRDGYSAAKEKLDEVDFGEMTNQVRTFVRANPAKALLISIGVGFALGLLLRRGQDDDDE